MKTFHELPHRWRRLMSLLLLLLPLAQTKAADDSPKDLIRVVDASAGIDTVYTQVWLEVENLYTDTLRVGMRSQEDAPVGQWFDQAQIEYFRHKGVMYEPRQLILDNGESRRLLLQRDRGRGGSNALIYTLGEGQNRKQYVRQRSDEQLHPLVSADGHFSRYVADYFASMWSSPSPEVADYIARTKPTRAHFRLAERISHQHNDHYLRHFTYGVLAGMHLTEVRADRIGNASSQLCATAGLWADMPLDTWGTSLRVEANYFAFSSMFEDAKHQFAYNYRGIDVPLLLRYTALPVKGRVMPYLEGGVALGIAMSGDLKGEVRVPDDQGDYYYFWYGDQKSGLPLNVLVGAGVEVQLTPRHSLWAGLRYRFAGPLDEYDPRLDETAINEDGPVAFDRSGWMFTLMFNL